MIEALIHGATVTTTTTDRRLAFDAGSAVFTVGKTVTGAASEATGTVKSVTKTAGDWAAGTAVGYLVLSGVFGTFRNDEAIADNGDTPGAAVANGADVDNTDDYGVRTTTKSPTTVRCRFVNPKGGTRRLESGEHIFMLPSVLLPAGTVVSEGDTVTGTPTGYVTAFRVVAIRPVHTDEGLHHLRCDLEAVA